MKVMRVIIFLVFVSVAGSLYASDKPFGGSFSPNGSPCLSPEDRHLIKERLELNVLELKAKGLLSESKGGDSPLFIWPVVQNPIFNDRSIWAVTNFVDQNPAFPNQVLDYQGGMRTYDTNGGYNHRGVDIILWPFGWEMMDRDQGLAVAAAPGIIISKDDGNQDRSCSLPAPNPSWNAVYIQHADGSRAWYGHLKKNSLIDKPVGAGVVEGEVLGVVGSSGNSTNPHLHFEIYDAMDNLNDPFQGPFNNMNPNSWWQDQNEYYEPLLLRLMTHDDMPSINGFCPEDEIINRANSFLPGDRVYTSAHYRDQREGDVTQFQLKEPDGTLYVNWSHEITFTHLSSSWWYWFWDLPVNAPEGAWTFTAEFQGQTMSHTFIVGSCQAQFNAMLDSWPNITVLDLIPLAACGPGERE